MGSMALGHLFASMYILIDNYCRNKYNSTITAALYYLVVGKMTLKEYLIDKYGYNEPICVNEIQFKDYSRPWVFKELKKLVDNGEIRRFDLGIYYFPKKMPFGDSYLNPRKVVEHRFLSNGCEVYGYIAGASLLNQAGLTTQVPNLIELVTNNESTCTRHYGWKSASPCKA